MIPVSKEFEQYLKNDERNYIIEIDMVLHDGTKLKLNNTDIWDSGVTFEESTSSTSSFDIGAAVIGKCTLVLNNIYDKFSKYDFFGATFTLYIGLQLSEKKEMIRKGFYTVDEPKYNGSIITLECLDNMWKFDTPYSEVKTSYPATLGVIVADICLHCGVSLGKANFPNYTYSIPSRPEVDMNCREVISYIAQISCLYAKISNNGSLVFDWYSRKVFSRDIDGGYFDAGVPKYESGDDVDGGNFIDYSSGDDVDGGTFEDLRNMTYITSTSSSNVHTDDIVITGIRVLEENDEGYNELYGEDIYVLDIKDNPFVTKKNAKEIASYVGSRIVGMFFRPFDASALNDVSVEAGDACIIQDFRGNKYYSFITNLSFSVWNYENFSCHAETPNRKKTVRYSESLKTAVQIRRETQEKISNYEKAVQNMNQLAGNALGYHTTYEELPDGSRITYLHDKPSLSESKIVYKQTIDGFFISQDGGKTYTSGFDSDGNAVVNILYAIGIVADWIRGGTLTLGGDNNIDGSCVIYDANGNEIGRFDKDGISTNSANITGGSISIQTDDKEYSYITLRSESNFFNVSPSSLTFGFKSLVSNLSVNGLFFNNLKYYDGNTLKINDTEVRNGKISIGTGISFAPSLSNINGWKISENSFADSSGKYSLSSTAANFKNTLYAEARLSVKGGITVSDGSIDAFSSTARFQSMYVSGTKSRISLTKNYSDRLLYCYETPTPYFGDIGEATLDENGICYIFIDDIFLETINTDCSYQVFLQKYGNGDLWVEKRTPSYFIAKGTPGLNFAWEIKAKQKGYEYERIDKFSNLKKEEIVDYESEADLYIKNYYEELMNYEESNEHDNFNNSRREED